MIRHLFENELAKNVPDYDKDNFEDVINLISGSNNEKDNNVCASVSGEFLLNCINLLSKNLPLQNANVTILRSLCRGNSGLFLAIANNKVVVIKEHVFSAGSFLLTSNILYELNTLLCFYLARATYFEQVASNLPQLLQIETSRNSLRIVLEHIPLSVEDICDRRLPVDFLKFIFTEIVNVVERLHSMNFTHRDIKPENVRFRANGTPVLIDFDSCKFSENSMLRTFPICTLHARSPELIVKTPPENGYDGKALDVYSLGLLFVYMCNTSRPLVVSNNNLEELKEVLTNILPLTNNLTQRLGPELCNVVTQMLTPDPIHRPTITEIKFMLKSS
jgi:serine/threonine protein kinase